MNRGIGSHSEVTKKRGTCTVGFGPATACFILCTKNAGETPPLQNLATHF
jgi:hypothetical protein